MATTIGARNPLRYRSYIWDTELGLFYLQSRYYSPKIGRFINADEFASTGQGPIGNNMFAYCLNNPVNMSDSEGNLAGILGEALVDAAIGGIVNAISTFASTGSLEEAGWALLVGAGQGFITGLFDVFTPIISIYNAIDTFMDCRNSGAGILSSLGAASCSFAAEMILGKLGIDADIADLIIGLGYSLGAQAISEGIVQYNKSQTSAKPANKSNPPNSSTAKTHTTGSRTQKGYGYGKGLIRQLIF